jgi:putative oxidoreductase
MSARDTLPRPDAQYEPEETQRMDLPGLAEDHQRTIVVPSGRTTLQPASEIAELDDAIARERERERRRAERDEALGTRRKAVEAVEEPEAAPQQPKAKRTTDKFAGSAGLFLVRVVAAGIIGLHGFAKALDLGAVQRVLAQTVIPEPVIMSYVLTGAEVAIALALLFGLLTRLAGLGLAAIGIGALVFVHWVTNPFTGNQLTGELELLLGAVGLLFVCLGAGGWSIDRAFRRRAAAGA